MNYKDTSSISIEGFGENGPFGIKIMIFIPRELNAVDSSMLSQKCHEIHDALEMETAKHDEKLLRAIKDSREKIISLFPQSIFVEEIPNEYHNRGNLSQFPWFIVTTPKGRIKIGWRKRVINIDWDDSIIQIGAKELFPDENVTKEGKYIHAYGYEKAKEYIDKLLSADTK